MSERVNVLQTAHGALKGMLELENSIKLDQRLREMVKTRASVINGCSYCLDMHTTDMLADGEDIRRVIAIAAYRESPFFTPRERAALELTDAITNISVAGVPDAVYAEARKHFNDDELANLIQAIVAINAWNRFAIVSETQPPALATPAAATA